MWHLHFYALEQHAPRINQNFITFPSPPIFFVDNKLQTYIFKILIFWNLPHRTSKWNTVTIVYKQRVSHGYLQEPRGACSNILWPHLRQNPGERRESDSVFPFHRVCSNPKSLQIAGNKINQTAERRSKDRAESIAATPSSLYYTGIPEMIPGGDSFRVDSCNLGCPSRSTSVKGRAIRK